MIVLIAMAMAVAPIVSIHLLGFSRLFVSALDVFFSWQLMHHRTGLSEHLAILGLP
jgi:hypothetical protein